MKKIGIFLVVILLVVINAKAQTKLTTESRNEISLGLRVGANYSNVYDSEGQDFVANGKFGFTAGGFIVIPLGEVFGLQPEVLYSQKGFKSSGTFLGTAYSMTRTTDFIDVPIFFSIKPDKKISLLFGPQFSYLMKQKDAFTGGMLNSNQKEQFDNSNLRKNILGLTGGADINIAFFVIGIRAGWDVKNNDGDRNTTTPRYKNMWYQATIGYKF